MADTHLNVFEAELEAAYKKAHAAIEEFYQSVKTIRTKYQAEIKALAPDVQTAEETIAKVEATTKGKGSKSKPASNS